MTLKGVQKLSSVEALTQQQLAARLQAGELCATLVPEAVQTLRELLTSDRDMARLGSALAIIRIATTQEAVKAVDEASAGKGGQPATVIVLENRPGAGTHPATEELERRLAAQRAGGDH